MLNKKQLDLLKKSNKTLAIIGRFHNEDEQIRYVFNNADGKDGKISVANLFAKLKPELRSSSKSTLTIGDTIFNQYELDTPLNAGSKGNSQPISFDSPLLDGTMYSGEEAKNIQKQGKEVVKQLIESLDTVAYFTDSHFAKSLLKIAKHYLFLEANENLEHKIAEDAQWNKTIYSDNSFCSRIVQYLTAHEQDESEIETAFRKSLKSFKNNSDREIYTDEQVNQLAKALIRCKRLMLDRTEEDVTWNKIAKTRSFSWLNNYASDPEYGLSHPQIGTKVGDKNFLAYYNAFMEASEKIHRLVRTQAIHSSIFCWLASKYTEWDVASMDNASKKMYEIGVTGQKEKRIPGESKEARQRNKELIKKAEVEPKLANEVEGDDNYQIFAEKAEDNIFEALLPDRAVTLKALRLRAKNLFKKLNQIAGGKAGQILKENDEFNQLFVKYYRTILKIGLDARTDAGIEKIDLDAGTDAGIEKVVERLYREAARDREVERFNNFDIKGFIDVVINKAKEKEGEGNFKIKVKEAFIGEYAHKSKNRFAEEYLKNQVQIKEEEQLAQEIYDLRSMQEVGSKGKTAGAPVYVMTDLSMPNFDDIDEDIKIIRRKKNQQEAQAATQASFTTSITAARPTKLTIVSAGKVTDDEGKELGSYKIQEDKIELKAQDIEAAGVFDSTKAQMEVGGKIYKLHELDIPEIMDFPKPDEIKKANTIAEAVQNNYSQLSKSMDTILQKYRSQDAEEPDFNRAFRSLLLCEYIQAAPQGTTQIGREDLSNILGLMVDITEHLGEVNNPKILDGVLSEEPELGLDKINLSKYYPVEEKEDGKRQISSILQYQYELCKNLNNVKNYLQELAEIKSFFEIMQRTDLEIIVLNTTVGEYGDLNNIGYESSFITDSPSVVYLTSQSQVSVDSLTTMADTLAALIIDNSENTTNLQIPIFVSSQTLPIDKVPLPLICPTKQLDLPNLVFDTNESSENKKLNIVVDWKERQNTYLLLSAAIMLPDSSVAMGSLTNFKPPVSMGMRNMFDINLKKNQPVADLLREFWLSPKCQILDTLIFTKWLNLMVLAKRTENTINIKEQFGIVLDEKLWKPRELREVCEAAFATLPGLVDIPIKVEMNGQFSSPSSLGGGTCSIAEMYGTDLERNPRYIFELPWKNLFAEKLN